MARSERRETGRPMDPWLILAGTALAVVGLVIIDSVSQATTALSGLPHLYFVQRQLMWLGVGVIAFVVMAAVDYHAWARYTWVFYAIAVLSLLAVLVHGHSALGAQRWIQIGPFPFQPSELTKLLLVGTLSGYLAGRAGHVRRVRDIASPLLLTLVPALLVLKQPDLGTTLILLFVLIGLLYMADSPISNLALVFGGAFALGVAAIYAHLRFHTPLPLVHAYQLQRLLIFLNPASDPSGAGWSIEQSRIALGSGGLFGTGLFAGPETQLSFLPEPFTDFVFASLAEQLGLIGAGAVLILFLVVMWRGLSIAADAPDAYGTLLAGGVVTMLAAQVVMNTGMSMGVMPVVGVPLPLVSYGGSSLLTTAAALGVLTNVGRAGRSHASRRSMQGYDTLPKDDGAGALRT